MFVLREKATYRMRFSRSQSSARNALASSAASPCIPAFILSSGESHQQDELSPVNKVELSPLSTVATRSRRIPHGSRCSAPTRRLLSQLLVSHFGKSHSGPREAAFPAAKRPRKALTSATSAPPRARNLSPLEYALTKKRGGGPRAKVYPQDELLRVNKVGEYLKSYLKFCGLRKRPSPPGWRSLPGGRTNECRMHKAYGDAGGEGSGVSGAASARARVSYSASL